MKCTDTFPREDTMERCFGDILNVMPLLFLWWAILRQVDDLRIMKIICWKKKKNLSKVDFFSPPFNARWQELQGCEPDRFNRFREQFICSLLFFHLQEVAEKLVCGLDPSQWLHCGQKDILNQDFSIPVSLLTSSDCGGWFWVFQSNFFVCIKVQCWFQGGSGAGANPSCLGGGTSSIYQEVLDLVISLKLYVCL